MQQRNVAIAWLDMEVTMNEQYGHAPMLPHSPWLSQTSLLHPVRGLGCSLQALAQVQPYWAGPWLPATSQAAEPGQHLPEDALISEVRFELVFQGRRSKMGSWSAEHGQAAVFLVMPQPVLPQQFSCWVSALHG